MRNIKRFIYTGLGVIAILLLTATQTACNRREETEAEVEPITFIAEEEDKPVALSQMSGENNDEEDWEYRDDEYAYEAIWEDAYDEW